MIIDAFHALKRLNVPTTEILQRLPKTKDPVAQSEFLANLLVVANWDAALIEYLRAFTHHLEREARAREEVFAGDLMAQTASLDETTKELFEKVTKFASFRSDCRASQVSEDNPEESAFRFRRQTESLRKLAGVLQNLSTAMFLPEHRDHADEYLQWAKTTLLEEEPTLADTQFQSLHGEVAEHVAAFAAIAQKVLKDA